MNWDALGAVAEMIGAIAVLVTLIYLASQVRHSKILLERNEKIALSQVYAERAKSRIEDLRSSASNPAIIKMWAKERGVDEETILKRNLILRNVTHYDNVLYQHELGLIPEDDLHRITKLIQSGYPQWKELGLEIGFKRVEDWYHNHSGDA